MISRVLFSNRIDWLNTIFPIQKKLNVPSCQKDTFFFLVICFVILHFKTKHYKQFFNWQERLIFLLFIMMTFMGPRVREKATVYFLLFRTALDHTIVFHIAFGSIYTLPVPEAGNKPILICSIWGGWIYNLRTNLQIHNILLLHQTSLD